MSVPVTPADDGRGGVDFPSDVTKTWQKIMHVFGVNYTQEMVTALHGKPTCIRKKTFRLSNLTTPLSLKWGIRS